MSCQTALATAASMVVLWLQFQLELSLKEQPIAALLVLVLEGCHPASIPHHCFRFQSILAD